MTDYNKFPQRVQRSGRRFVFSLPCTLITCCVAAFLFTLCGWQWHRATWKQSLLDRMQAAQQLPAKHALAWLASPDAALTRLRLHGRFDTAHQIWLQSMHHHQVGYDVWVPFLPSAHETHWVWVDWGWQPAHGLRASDSETLPKKPGDWEGLVVALPEANLPGIHAVDQVNHWPLVAVAVNWSAIETALGRHFSAMAWRLSPPSPKGWLREHPVVAVSPARHRAYALQWLLLGLAALWVGYRLQCQRRND